MTNAISHKPHLYGARLCAHYTFSRTRYGVASDKGITMDRYNTLVSRHLIAAVIEVGQAKGGVTLDTDAMAGWLATLPAKERSNLAETCLSLHTLATRAGGLPVFMRRATDGGGHCGPYKTCQNCRAINDADAEECSACGRLAGAA